MSIVTFILIIIYYLKFTYFLLGISILKSNTVCSVIISLKLDSVVLSDFGNNLLVYTMDIKRNISRIEVNKVLGFLRVSTKPEVIYLLIML